MREEEKILERGRRGALRFLYGRTVVVMLLLLIQVALMVFVMQSFSKYIPAFFGGYMVFALCIVLIIINQPDTPEIKLTWSILILLLPIVGGMFYVYVKTQPGYRLIERRLEGIYQETEKFVQQDEDVLHALEEADKGTAQLVQYVHKHGNFSVYRNTNVRYFPLGEDKFSAMLEQLERAEQFIFLEYFIVKEGEMWNRILQILQKKAKEGVEVRVMYDGTCALFHLPYHYPEVLEKMGIRCKLYAPIQPILSTHYNNRDHRKILVIDGKVGFTGGVNIGDEYINHVNRFGHWKDTAVLLEGDAVQGLTMLFLQMWHITEPKPNYANYLRLPATKQREQGFVMPYGDSPFDDELIGEMVYMDILNRAKEYVHIMTPYLILDEQILTALTYAAKRGVDVKLILPHIPDKKFAFALAKNHYPVLLRAGVKIYEYTPGFVHAKVFTCDDEKAVVGTINLDYRSLYLHFECAAFLYRVSEIIHMEQDFQRTLEQCTEITLETYKKGTLGLRIKGWLLKVLAPLL